MPFLVLLSLFHVTATQCCRHGVDLGLTKSVQICQADSLSHLHALTAGIPHSPCGLIVMLAIACQQSLGLHLLTSSPAVYHEGEWVP